MWVAHSHSIFIILWCPGRCILYNVWKHRPMIGGTHNIVNHCELGPHAFFGSWKCYRMLFLLIDVDYIYHTLKIESLLVTTKKRSFWDLANVFVLRQRCIQYDISLSHAAEFCVPTRVFLIRMLFLFFSNSGFRFLEPWYSVIAKSLQNSRGRCPRCHQLLAYCRLALWHERYIAASSCNY